jgi:3-hydroxyisobutyrate dehydrogenase-like beta-hydroxyacid dehydrogenase
MTGAFAPPAVVPRNMHNLKSHGGRMMAAAKKTVGVVGLGIMGGAFARNLHKAGWRVVGYDIDAKRRRLLAKNGVVMAENAAEVARRVPVIITSLPNPEALEVTAKAICDARLPRRVVIEAGTFALDDKSKAEKQLSKAGHILLDCPVSGTGAQADKKDLVIYASGDRRTIARLRPLFAGFSRQVHDIGAFGNGSRMKYVANLLVAIHNVASAEAFVLGLKAGLDPQTIFKLVTAGAANSRIFELRAPMMVRNRYGEATMKVSTWQKDMAVIGEYAQQLGSPTPLFSATLPIYAAAMATGHGAEDTASVCAVLEAMAGLRRRRS